MTIKFDVVDADKIILEMDKQVVEEKKKINVGIKLFYKEMLIPVWQYDAKSLLLVHEAGIRSK